MAGICYLFFGGGRGVKQETVYWNSVLHSSVRDNLDWEIKGNKDRIRNVSGMKENFERGNHFEFGLKTLTKGKDIQKAKFL